MDFTVREHASQPNTNRFSQVEIKGNSAPDSKNDKADKPKHDTRTIWVQTWLMIFLICITGLLVSVVIFLGFNERNDEGKYVDSGAIQAVEVNNGTQNSFYFGNIAEVNSEYLVLNNTTELFSPAGQNPVVIASLKCDSPFSSSQLVISRNKVISWGNLASDSSVALAVKQLSSSNGVCPSAPSSTTTSDVGQSTSTQSTSVTGTSNQTTATNTTSGTSQEPTSTTKK